MSVKINLPSTNTVGRVSVMELEGGDVFIDSQGDYGVRTCEGWMCVRSTFLMSYVDDEIVPQEYCFVLPRPDLKCTLTIEEKQ